MKISGLIIKTSRDKVRIQANVESNNGLQLLWFELDKKYKDFLTHDRYDAFVISLLNSALARDESIFVEGALSTDLLSHLVYYINTITPFYPGVKNILIYPKEVTTKNCNLKQSEGASFMLSKDSLKTIQAHFSSIEYLIYANFGEYYAGKAPGSPAGTIGFGQGKTGTWEGISFPQRVAKLKKANEKYLHKELIVIDSNLEAFAKPLLDMELGFGTMTIGLALLLQGLLSRYYMPSSVYDYNFTRNFIPLPERFSVNELLEITHDTGQDSWIESQGQSAPGGNPQDPQEPQTGQSTSNPRQILNRCGVNAPGLEDCTACQDCISSMIPASSTGYKEIFFNVFTHWNPEEKNKPFTHSLNPTNVIPGIINEGSLPGNFDVSVILPFYKKYHDFVKVLPANAKYFSRPGVEVILVMDEPTEEQEVLNLIRHYPHIHWLVIVNDKEHAWRNPTKALNVGIKHASKKYTLVISPESEMATDIMYQFRSAIQGNQDYCIGQFHFKVYGTSRCYIVGLPYGSIMVSRDNLVKIGGYDESFSKWGGDDDNLRSRLKLLGVRETLIPWAHVIHWEKKRLKRPPRLSASRRDPLVDKIFRPSHWLANNGVFGNDFNRIAYDYRKPDKKP
jgi:hypothetical protein